MLQCASILSVRLPVYSVQTLIGGLLKSALERHALQRIKLTSYVRRWPLLLCIPLRSQTRSLSKPQRAFLLNKVTYSFVRGQIRFLFLLKRIRLENERLSDMEAKSQSIRAWRRLAGLATVAMKCQKLADVMSWYWIVQ